jgi:hypothetical protein
MVDAETQGAGVGAGPDPAGAWRRTRQLAAILLWLLVLELASIAVTAPGPGQSTATATSRGLAKVAGSTFAVTGTIAAAPACDREAPLVPGIERCLVYTIHNLLDTPITVTAISIQHVDAPEACPAASLDLTQSAFTGAVVVPAGARAATPGRPIVLRHLATNQDACKGATFTFTYAGTATAGAAAP